MFHECTTPEKRGGGRGEGEPECLGMALSRGEPGRPGVFLQKDWERSRMSEDAIFGSSPLFTWSPPSLSLCPNLPFHPVPYMTTFTFLLHISVFHSNMITKKIPVHK